jgi:hypothetical protein
MIIEEFKWCMGFIILWAGGSNIHTINKNTQTLIDASKDVGIEVNV